ncbi:phage baseplate assembly protein V [Sphingomonas sp. Mn802worker]|uniref:phage baseplate assembly protein V n=1 Tax=Sphingomonas sp. Mn802worker TaxID=629773 RepID=UPI000368275F|nr:phage baseplate assembly protein V [Sphingomonas sp. Mn802worker]
MAEPYDYQRLIGDIAREGSVVSVDLETATARIQLADDLVTGDLPWLSPRMGDTRVWSPPSVGEQVLVIAPESDIARGIIMGSLSSSARPQPARDKKTLLDFADRALIGYDPTAHALTAYLPAGATIVLVADGGLNITGDLTIEGEIRSTGKIVSAADVVGAGKSLKDHVHVAVQSGQGLSGKPQ